MSVFVNATVAHARRLDGREQVTITTAAAVGGDASLMVNTSTITSKAQLKNIVDEMAAVMAGILGLK